MVTIKDIARELNLSPATVSRALNDFPAISNETKKIVRECAERMNYTPDRNARNLVNRDTRSIGFMIPDISDNFYSYSASGVEEVLHEQGYEIFYSTTNRKQERVIEFLKRAKEYRYSGVFLTPDKWDASLIELVHSIGIPVVSLRRKTPFTQPEIPYVDSDHYTGCKNATEYLISLGHKKVGLIAMDTLIERERMQGYEDAIRRHGLDPHIVFMDFSTDRMDNGYKAAAIMRQKYPEVTAIMATADLQAIGAMEYFNEVDVRIPEDISLIGCDDRPEGRLYPIQLTTVHQALPDLGRQAAEMMLKMIREKEYHPVSVCLQPRLIVRKTTKKLEEK